MIKYLLIFLLNLKYYLANLTCVFLFMATRIVLNLVKDEESSNLRKKNKKI